MKGRNNHDKDTGTTCIFTLLNNNFFSFTHGLVNKNPRRLKKSWSLNIKAMKLKTVLFYPRYVKLGPVIYSVLIGHFFPLK